MKQTLLLSLVLSLFSFYAYSQNEIIYMVKDGKVIKQYNLSADVDSIVFYSDFHPSLPSSGIRPYSKNKHYWQYDGKPILLFGGSDSDNIFHWAGEGTKLTDHLDILKNCGGNYIRCTMSSRKYTPDGYRWDLLPYPYAKINGKYNLSVWNEEYWDMLQTFLVETQKRGIIVQLEVWDRWNESGDSEKRVKGQAGWFESPYNPNNNVNYLWNDSPLLQKGRTDFYNKFHFAANSNDPVLLPVQKQFINKILDLIIDNNFNHVIFQIDNESGIGDNSLEPDPFWARYIREYAESKNKNFPVYVCTSRRFHTPTPFLTQTFQNWNNPEIREPILNSAFNFCDISQNNGNSGQLHYDNLIWYRNKVNEYGVRPINHVKCYHFNWATGSDFNTDRTPATDEEAFSKFWRAVFAGAASIRFHRNTPSQPGSNRDGFGLTPEGQVHLKSMKMFTDSINIFEMSPDNDLLSDRSDNEAYCLAEIGQQYAVFFTGEGNRSVRLNLSGNLNAFNIKWLDVNNNKWVKSGQLIENEEIILSSPGAGSHWVAVIINEH